MPRPITALGPSRRLAGRPIERAASWSLSAIANRKRLRQGFVRIEPLNRRVRGKISLHSIAEKPARIRGPRSRNLRHRDDPGYQAVGRVPAARSCAAGGRSGALSAGALRLAWPFDCVERTGRRTGPRAGGAEPDLSYLDGLLGRLRREIPDPEARFHAYRSLEVPGLVNYRRLQSWRFAASAAWTTSSASRSASSSWKISGRGGYFTPPCGRTGRYSTC